MTESMEGQVFEMCDLSKGIEERGIRKGRREGRMEAKTETEISAIKSLMNKLKMTAEQAMDILDISMDRRAEYVNMI